MPLPELAVVRPHDPWRCPLFGGNMETTVEGRHATEIDVPISSLVHGASARNVEYIQNLLDSLPKVGQLHPLLVRRKGEQYEVLAGNRRLKAARELGWETLRVRVYEGESMRQELASLHENLVRMALSKEEEALWLARQKEIYLALYPETKRGGKKANGHGGRSKKNEPFTKKAAKETNQSERTVRRKVKIGQDAILAVRKAWSNEEITDNEAERLAGLPAEEQQAELERILAQAPVAAPQPTVAMTATEQSAVTATKLSAVADDNAIDLVGSGEKLVADAKA